MGKLWKASPDEKLAVVPQRAHGKLMVGKGSGIHIYPPRWTQAPSIHPLDSEDGYYVGIITAPAGAMASSRRKCQGGCPLIVNLTSGGLGTRKDGEGHASFLGSSRPLADL